MDYAAGMLSANGSLSLTMMDTGSDPNDRENSCISAPENSPSVLMTVMHGSTSDISSQ